MKRLERLVVHVEEAVRLGTADDEPHLRLGLMLIDSAAELLMHRETEYVLGWTATLYDSWLQMAEQYRDATGEGQDKVDELRAKVVSKTKRRSIEREFDAKCDFLVTEGTLPEPHSRALKKLHIYRNETYHRDQLRPATLANATKIYIYLVCSMMTTFPVHSMGYSFDQQPGFLARYLNPGEKPFGIGAELQVRVAQKLLAEAGVDKPLDLGQALAEHVAYRLDELEGAIEECTSFFNDMNERGWDLQAVLGMLQAPEPDDKMDYVRRTVADYRAWAKPVNKAQIRRWRHAGEALAGETDDLAAFGAFADIEDAFEPIEAKAMKLALDVDREIQHQIDVARGK